MRDRTSTTGAARRRSNVGSRRREEGLGLLVTVLILVLMGGIAMAALDTVSRDGEIAGLQNRHRSSFYAAEAGVAEARAVVRGISLRSALPAFYTNAAPKTLGDQQLYDHELAQPRFYGDPAFPNPIRYTGEAPASREGFNLSVAGQHLSNTLWQINVIGESADGSPTRAEVVEIKVMAQGY